MLWKTLYLLLCLMCAAGAKNDIIDSTYFQKCINFIEEPEIEGWNFVPSVVKVTGYGPWEGEYWDCRGKRMQYGFCAMNNVKLNTKVLVWHPQFGFFMTEVKDRLAKKYSNRIDIFLPTSKKAKLLTTKGIKVWVYDGKRRGWDVKSMASKYVEEFDKKCLTSFVDYVINRKSVEDICRSTSMCVKNVGVSNIFTEALVRNY